MALRHYVVPCVLFACSNWHCFALGFMNLGFESTPVSQGTDPNTGQPAYSIPNWTVELNGSPQSGVEENDYILDYTTAAILTGSSAISGNQSIYLAASSYESPVNGFSTASVMQSGFVYGTANSLQFELGGIDGFGRDVNTNFPQNYFYLTMNGQNVPLTILSDTGSILTLGGNISAWQGQTALLSIGVSVPYTAFSNGENLFSGTIDSVVLSPTTVPEPSALALFTLALTAIYPVTFFVKKLR